jgi:RNA polymerase sigma factor (sigma-70 family)
MSSRPILPPAPDFDPIDLLARARRLDRNALGVLHQTHYPAVYGYIHFRLADIQVCQEIAAQVFQQFLQALRKRRAPRDNLSGWLFQAAARLVDQRLRQTGKFRPAEAPPLSSGALPLVGDAPYQSSQIYAALQSMPANQQHFLALRFVEDRTLNEVAQLLKKTDEQVRALQQRALTTLRKHLGEMP